MECPIPEGVKVQIRSRKCVVTGPKGTLKRDFSHLTLNLFVKGKNEAVVAELWMGGRKALASVRTVISHISNLIVGVTRGFHFEMRLVYNHFPITVNIENDGKLVELRNFVGERLVRRVTARGDTNFAKHESAKETIVITGIDLDDVSQSAANIQQICRVRNKDIRKFLDGIYVSKSGPADIVEA